MTEKPQSLGQVAFERLREQTVLRLDKLVDWEGQPREVRGAYENAANAVADEVTGNLRQLCKEIEPEIDALTQSPWDCEGDSRGLDLARKLYDAIMDPEEAKP